MSDFKPGDRLKSALIWAGIGVAAFFLVDEIRMLNSPNSHSTLDNLYVLCKRNVTCRNFISIDDPQKPIRVVPTQGSGLLARPAPGEK